MLDSYNNNLKIIESLKQVNIHSIDDILGKFEGWPLVLSARTLSTTELETLDHPQIHYRAIRALFMGKDLSELRKQYMEIGIPEKVAARYNDNWKAENPRPLLEIKMFQ